MDRTENLAAAGARLVTALAGHWHGDRGMCCCPAHSDRVASLSVRVGERTLLFKCFAGCETDAVLAALRAERYQVPRVADVMPRIAQDPGSRRGRDLWIEALPITGTIGETYLRHRFLEVRPPALRFHARTPLGRGANLEFRPAILAAVAGKAGVSAVQRSFLRPDGKGLAADLLQPRACLGRLWNGAVKLAPASGELGLAEGVETALSAAALLGIPVWAVLGSTRLHVIELPRQVRRLVLLPDNDRAGRMAARKAEAAYRNRGLDVVIEWPWHALNDWNDVLGRRCQQEEREKGWGG